MEKEDKDRQLQECLELAEQKLQQMLLEVEAELAQRVAALSKVLLLVPGGAGVGRASSLAVPPCPSQCCSVHKGAQTRGRAARLRWERPECQTVPAPVSSLR